MHVFGHPSYVIRILLLVFGVWYALFCFAVVDSTARGEERLPTPLIPRLFDDEALSYAAVSLFRWFLSWVTVLMPAAAYLLLALFLAWLSPDEAAKMIFGAIDARLQVTSNGMAPLVALVCAGLVCWPSVVPYIGQVATATAYRADLMIVTIARTLPAYLLVVAFVFAAAFVGLLLA